MRQFGKYILCTFVVLLGVSWFFQKINKYDFYCRYFRIIEELNIRNSHALSVENEQVVVYKNIFLKSVFTSSISLFVEKNVPPQNISVSDKQYCQIDFLHILAFLSTKMKESIPFSIAPPMFLAA